MEESRQREEAFAWNEVRDTREKWKLEDFIKKNPNSAFVGAAQERLADLVYAVAATANTLDAYNGFLKQYPNSSKAVEARETIARLTAQADEAAFGVAKNTKRYFDLVVYTKTFPTGAHAGEVTAMMADYKWIKATKPKLITWESLATSLLDSTALQETLKAEIKFGAIASMPLKGNVIQPLNSIFFVAKDTGIGP